MSQNDLDNSVGKPLIVAGLGDVGAQLDRCFLPLGLRSESGFGTRKYGGEVNGRSITITIAARTRTQYLIGSIRYRKFTGLWMDVSVSTTVASRLMLGQPDGLARRVTGFIQRLKGNKLVTNLSSVSKTFVAFAHDPAWAEMFLAETAVQTQLTTLMKTPDLPPGAAVFLSPGNLGSPGNPGSMGSTGKWQWTTPALPSSFTPEAVQSWLAQLTGLAAHAEKNPPPTAVQPNWIERQNPTVVAVIVAVAFLFGIPFLLFLCCFLPAMALIILNGGF